MRKFLAVVKREYLKIVWSKTFILSTLFIPLAGLIFSFVPILMMTIEGDATHLLVVDQSGRMSEAVIKTLTETQSFSPNGKQDALAQLNSSQQEQLKENSQKMKSRFIVEKFDFAATPLEQVKRELNERLRAQKLDAYLVIPTDLANAPFELYARNASNITMQSRVGNAVNQAVRRVRMKEEQISPEKLDAINRNVELDTVRVSDDGEAEDSGESFFLVFGIGLLLMLTLTLYGQSILAAVVEEKETRIAEILFSSARPFTLMMGKIVGVGLSALTQLGIWILSILLIALYALPQLSRTGFNFSLPQLSPAFFLLMTVYFLLGFLTYSTIYALIGSMVTTVQEGGQFALIALIPLMGSFYSLFPVMNSPGSNFSVWLSLLPFTAPLVMPVRVAVQTPPLWQIGLSIALNIAAVIALTWLAARIYRIGMLMYGKKATIPEVWRWIRQN